MKKIKFIILLLVVIPIFSINLNSFFVGALDPPYWNGIVFYENGKIYGFRFVIVKNGKKADGYDTFFIVEEPGVISPDFSYAEIGFNTFLEFGLGRKTPIPVKGKTKEIFKIRYAKYKEGIVSHLKIPEKVKIILKFYSPWGRGEKFHYDGKRVLSIDRKIRFYPVESQMKCLKCDSGFQEFLISGRDFYFYFGKEDFNKDSSFIDKHLDSNKKDYLKKRFDFEGEFGDVNEAITQNIYWMKLLIPSKGMVYVPAGRRWIFPGKEKEIDDWTMFEWDSFFNAVELALEDFESAHSQIYATLKTQYPWGNIPNWRSETAGSTDRAQPPVGAYLTLKVFKRTGNLELLKKSYEGLVKFHNYWLKNSGKHLKRDGNNNFLFEWGSDTELINSVLPPWEVGADGETRARWESGQDDLPNYDDVKFNEKTNTIELDCVDLSSLVALDSLSLLEISKILKKHEDKKRFFMEYEKIKKQVNRFLWDEKDGFYYDRYWNGKLSKRKASSNFYPLLSKIATKEQAKRVVKHLLNPKEFWGDYVIPTISRDDKAFKDQQYWRGTIWPPTNYLVYHALKAYEFDEIASEFSRKSVRLFLRSWRKFRLSRENYNSVTGEGGGQRYQSWGPLFALVLIEDFIDVPPFDDGLRVGNLSSKKKVKIKNYFVGKDSYSLEANYDSLSLYFNGGKIVEFHGRAVLRNIKLKDYSIEFTANVYSKDFYIKKLPHYKTVFVNDKKSSFKNHYSEGKYYFKIYLKSLK